MKNGWNNMTSNPEKTHPAGAFCFSGSSKFSKDYAIEQQHFQKNIPQSLLIYLYMDLTIKKYEKYRGLSVSHL